MALAISAIGKMTTSPFVPAPELLIVGRGQPSRRLSAADVTFRIIWFNTSLERREFPTSCRKAAAKPTPA